MVELVFRAKKNSNKWKIYTFLRNDLRLHLEISPTKFILFGFFHLFFSTKEAKWELTQCQHFHRIKTIGMRNSAVWFFFRSKMNEMIGHSVGQLYTNRYFIRLYKFLRSPNQISIKHIWLVYRQSVDWQLSFRQGRQLIALYFFLSSILWPIPSISKCTKCNWFIACNYMYIDCIVELWNGN